MIEIKIIDSHLKFDKPRRVTKYVLVYCSSGSITMLVDEKEFSIAAGRVITITSGQVHCITKTAKAKGFVMEFTLNFFCKDQFARTIGPVNICALRFLLAKKALISPDQFLPN